MENTSTGQLVPHATPHVVGFRSFTMLHIASKIAAQRILAELLAFEKGDRSERPNGNELASIIYETMRDKKEL